MRPVFLLSCEHGWDYFPWHVIAVRNHLLGKQFLNFTSYDITLSFTHVRLRIWKSTQTIFCPCHSTKNVGVWSGFRPLVLKVPRPASFKCPTHQLLKHQWVLVTVQKMYSAHLPRVTRTLVTTPSEVASLWRSPSEDVRGPPSLTGTEPPA